MIISIPESYFETTSIRFETIQYDGTQYEILLDSLGTTPQWSEMSKWITNQTVLINLKLIWPVYVAQRTAFNAYKKASTRDAEKKQRMQILRQRSLAQYDGYVNYRKGETTTTVDNSGNTIVENNGNFYLQ